MSSELHFMFSEIHFTFSDSQLVLLKFILRFLIKKLCFLYSFYKPLCSLKLIFPILKSELGIWNSFQFLIYIFLYWNSFYVFWKTCEKGVDSCQNWSKQHFCFVVFLHRPSIVLCFQVSCLVNELRDVRFAVLQKEDC